MRKLFFIIPVLFCLTSVFGQYKYSNDFLTIGVGTRALSMSKSVVAANKDVTSGYWNPAGLVNMKRKYEIGYMHASYFAGIANFDYLGGAMLVDEQTVIGLSALRLGVDNIQNTLNLIDDEGNWDYGRITYFSHASYAFIGSYAKKSAIQGLNYGANVKVIHHKIGDFASAWGFGLDLGGQYQKGKWTYGAVGKDLTSTFNAWVFNNEDLEEIFRETGNELPQNGLEVTMPSLLVGIARGVELSEDFNLLSELDFDVTFDGKRNALISTDPVSAYPRLGLELDYKKIVYLRGGIGNLQRVENFDEKRPLTVQPDFGVGIRYRNFTVDYALTNIASTSLGFYSNIFSIIYSFNPPK
jgi:hypothetical protein